MDVTESLFVQAAVRYAVSIADLKASNDLSGDVVRVGQVLRIPPAS